MSKLSKEQTKALLLLQNLLTVGAPLNDADKIIVGNFISECISNYSLNEAAMRLLIKNKNAPLAATFFVLSLSYRTRKLPEVSQSFEASDQYEIESLRHYSIVRDLAYLQNIFKTLPDGFINDHESLSQLQHKIKKSQELITSLDQKISEDMSSHPIGFYIKENKSLEQKLSNQILLYIKLLLDTFKQKENRPLLGKKPKP